MSTSCPDHPTPQDSNLDCISQPEELDVFIKNESLPKALREYAKERQLALQAEKAGDEATALEHNARCSILFPQIPEDYQW